MNIFYNNTIINRDRTKSFKKYIYKLNKQLDSLIQTKNQFEAYLPTIPLDKLNKIQRIQYRIQQLNSNINTINSILVNLSSQNNIITNVDTLPPDNSLSSNYIHNVHSYGKLTLPAFAPSYPVRINYE